MAKSMTGFGRGEAVGQEWQVKVEMKSVNHRYLDLAVRIGRDYAQLEEVVRRMVQRKLYCKWAVWFMVLPMMSSWQ